jgi:hypothetical protein
VCLIAPFCRTYGTPLPCTTRDPHLQWTHRTPCAICHCKPRGHGSLPGRCRPGGRWLGALGSSPGGGHHCLGFRRDRWTKGPTPAHQPGSPPPPRPWQQSKSGSIARVLGDPYSSVHGTAVPSSPAVALPGGAVTAAGGAAVGRAGGDDDEHQAAIPRPEPREGRRPAPEASDVLPRLRGELLRRCPQVLAPRDVDGRADTGEG